MKLVKKIFFLLIMLELVNLPSFAKIEGGVSKNHFYDTETTIMTEAPLDRTLKNGKYWEKNLFYFNKYRPLFMLSNDELYDLMPRENISIVQRITAPSVYNISLKSASIKTVSLKQPIVTKKQTESNVKKENIVVKTSQTTSILTSLYEQAKNPNTEPDKKIDIAISLKNSKNSQNYNFALELLNDVIKTEPYNAYAFYIKGEIYTEKNDIENAMKNYVQALKINPASKQSYLGIAKLLKTTNKELSQKYYDRAMLLSEK